MPQPAAGALSPLLLLLLLALFTSCSAPPPGAARLACRAADFGARLFGEVIRRSPDRNVAFSPYGAASVLAMLQAAAGGETRRQLERAMAYGLSGKAGGRARGALARSLAGGSVRPRRSGSHGRSLAESPAPRTNGRLLLSSAGGSRFEPRAHHCGSSKPLGGAGDPVAVTPGAPLPGLLSRPWGPAYLAGLRVSGPRPRT